VHAPPGYFVDEIDKSLKKCNPGEYCNLGRGVTTANNSRADLKCPQTHYCPTPDILFPSQWYVLLCC